MLCELSYAVRQLEHVIISICVTTKRYIKNSENRIACLSYYAVLKSIILGPCLCSYIADSSTRNALTRMCLCLLLMKNLMYCFEFFTYNNRCYAAYTYYEHKPWVKT